MKNWWVFFQRSKIQGVRGPKGGFKVTTLPSHTFQKLSARSRWNCHNFAPLSSAPSPFPALLHDLCTKVTPPRPLLLLLWNYSVAAFPSELGAKNTLKVNPGVGFMLLLPPPSPAISPQPSWPFYPSGNVVLISPLDKGRGNTAPFILP